MTEESDRMTDQELYALLESLAPVQQFKAISYLSVLWAETQKGQGNTP